MTSIAWKLTMKKKNWKLDWKKKKNVESLRTKEECSPHTFQKKKQIYSCFRKWEITANVYTATNTLRRRIKMEIVIKIIIVYWIIATLFLFNILFNPRLRLVWVNTKTGERTEPPYWIVVLISLYWIYFAVKFIIKRGKNKWTEKNVANM